MPYRYVLHACPTSLSYRRAQRYALRYGLQVCPIGGFHRHDPQVRHKGGSEELLRALSYSLVTTISTNKYRTTMVHDSTICSTGIQPGFHTTLQKTTSAAIDVLRCFSLHHAECLLHRFASCISIRIATIIRVGCDKELSDSSVRFRGIRFQTFTQPTLSNTEEEKQIEGATQTTVPSTTFVTIKDLQGRSTRELP